MKTVIYKLNAIEFFNRRQSLGFRLQISDLKIGRLDVNRRLARTIYRQIKDYKDIENERNNNY